MFSKIKHLWLKYLIIDQMFYLEQMYTRLLNHVDNHCWEFTNTTSGTSKWGTVSPYLFLFFPTASW